MSTHQERPWYKWFPRDFMASSNVQSMTWEERGMYRWLLDVQWLDESIPADHKKLARLLGLSMEQFAVAWEVIGPCFSPIPGDSTKLENTRLEIVKSEMIEAAEKAAEKGRRGGKASAAKRSQRPIANEPVVDPSSTQVEPSLDLGSTKDQADSNHADPDADYTSKSSKLDSDAVDAMAPPQKARRKKRKRKGQADPEAAAISDRVEVVDPPAVPEALPHAWPEDVRGLKRVAIDFLAAFGNCKSREAQAEHGAAYTDALSAMRGRCSPPEAWRAFGDCFVAHNGRPLFGSMAKLAMNYLPPTGRNKSAAMPRPAGDAKPASFATAAAALALLNRGCDE